MPKIPRLGTTDTETEGDDGWAPDLGPTSPPPALPEIVEPDHPYSPVRHLAYALQPNHDPDELLMVMFTAYFDASGHPKQKDEMSLSGFVATVGQWQHFERCWADHLKRWRIFVPFHMADFEASFAKQDNYKHFPYAHFHRKGKKMDRFLAESVTLLNHCTQYSFGEVCVIPEMRRAQREGSFPAWEPYTYLGFMILHKTFLWARQMARNGHASDQLEIIFECGDPGWEQLRRVAKAAFNTEIHCKSKDKLVPFQACDIVAWEHRKNIEMHYGGATSGRPSMGQMLEALKGSDDWQYLHYQSIAETSASPEWQELVKNAPV